jgi:uncharacterized membrane protein YdfJ with MMPL/SSD domain
MSMIRAARPGSAPAPRPLVAAPVSSLGRLGSWSYRHRRLVVAVWVAALIVFSLAGRLAGSAFKDNLNGGTSTPSQQAAAFLQRNFRSQAGDVAQVVFQVQAPVTSAAVRDRITSTLDGLARLPGVTTVLSPFAAGDAAQVSSDGHIAYGLVRFDASGDALPDAAIQQVIIQAQRAAGPGFAVHVGGAPVEKVEKPQFGKSEALGLVPAGSITADSDAVANALARTGRIITSAAAIMICVFAAFVLGDLRVLRVIGLGMAVAVLLDATLVRMVATPAILQLTGRSNWWFPRWLDRVMPSFLTEVLASTKGTS